MTEDSEADHLEMAKYRKVGPDGALRVSVKTEEGLNEVNSLTFWFSSLYIKVGIVLTYSRLQQMYGFDT